MSTRKGKKRPLGPHTGREVMMSAPLPKPTAATESQPLSLDVIAIDDERCRVSLRGDLDLAAAPLVQAALAAELAAGRRLQRVDTSEVTFCDSSGLRALLTAHRAALDARGTLIITGVPPTLDRLLRVAGLDHVLFWTNIRDYYVPDPAQPA